jgi:hypothetical protein
MGLLILTKREALIMNTFEESQSAFKHALSIQTFNEREDDYYYIGDWMFMGSGLENNQFKNRNTKEYIHINKEATHRV